MSAYRLLKWLYWNAALQSRRIWHPRLSSGSQVAWRASIRGKRHSITLARSCRVDEYALLDTRGGGEIDLGEQTQVHRFACLMAYGGVIRLGRNCSVNPFSVLYGHGGLSIGDNVRIAAHVVVVPANHRFDDPNLPVAMQGVTAKGITIEHDVWIGAGVRILDGCRIGRGAVIGAGAVVTRDVAPYSVTIGTAARHLRSRQE